MNIIITLKQLVGLGACEDQVEEFKSRFGKSVEVTESAALKVADVFDWNWLARHTLKAPAWAEYRRVKAPALAEYQRARAQAWARLYIAQVEAEATGERKAEAVA